MIRKILGSVSIKAKISLIVFTFLGSFIISAMVSHYYSGSTAEKTIRIKKEALTLTPVINSMKIEVIQVQQWLTDVSATRAKPGFDDGFAEAENYAKLFDEHLGQARALLVSMDRPSSVLVLDSLKSSFQGFYATGKKMAETYISQGTDAGNVYMEKFDPYAEDIVSRLEVVTSFQEALLEDQINQVIKATESSNTIPVIVEIIFGLLAMIIAWFVARNIAKPIAEVLKYNTIVSNGDFSENLKIYQTDELGMMGTQLNDLVTSFKSTLRKTFSNVSSVIASSHEVKNVSALLKSDSGIVSEKVNEISEGNNRISGNVTSISAGVEELSTSISTIASAIEEFNSSLQEVRNNTQTGAERSRHANEIVDSSYTKMQGLNQSSSQIGKIVEVINNIANQTNLLALNATIEAASAGEAGKGFAVVASEVKDLAKQTAQATQEIELQIQTMQEGITETIESFSNVKDAIVQVSDSSKEVYDSVEQQMLVLTEISESVGQTTLASNEISQNLNESNREIQNANEAIAETHKAIVNFDQLSSILDTYSVYQSGLSNKIYESLNVYTLSEKEIDINGVKLAHMKWAGKMISMLAGQLTLTASDVTRHTDCDFGKFLQSVDNSVKDSAAYKELVKAHKKVHESIEVVVETFNAHDVSKAYNKLNDFEVLRTKFFEALDSFYLQSI